MDFEKQKPISDKYRENWDRVFGLTFSTTELKMAIGAYIPGCGVISGTTGSYPNGCPILNENKDAVE